MTHHFDAETERRLSRSIQQGEADRKAGHLTTLEDALAERDAAQAALARVEAYIEQLSEACEWDIDGPSHWLYVAVIHDLGEVLAGAE